MSDDPQGKVCPLCYMRYDRGVSRCPSDDTVLRDAGDPRLGTVLAGRYRIRSVLGVGGMATVYSADQGVGGEGVAVKILHPSYGDEPRIRERLLREAQSVMSLSHPNIIEIFEHGVDTNGSPYLVMEQLHGEALDEMMRREKKLPPNRVIALGLQIARGLARAHDIGVMHRDIKPSNIFVCRSDDGASVVKIVDFGIALVATDPRLTKTGRFVGSPPYMAPERFSNPDVAAASADLYALGILLYEMATGTFPFMSNTAVGYMIHHMETPMPRAAEKAPDIPPVLDQLIAELCAKEPAHRPVDAHSVVHTLAGIATKDARRVRTVSVMAATDRRAGGDALRLEAWVTRAATYQRMLERARTSPNPPADWLERAVESIRAAVANLSALTAEARVTEEKRRECEAQAKADRARLGRAIESLAGDLSRVRRAERAAGETDRGEAALGFRAKLGEALALDAENPTVPRPAMLVLLEEASSLYRTWMAQPDQSEAADLQFQIDALRTQLSRVESASEEQRQALSKELSQNSSRRRSIELNLVAEAQRVSRDFGNRPELKDFFDEMRNSSRQRSR